MLSWIGWVATIMFAASYLCKRPTQLRLMQAFASLLWIGYGIVIGALPIIIANILVAAMAAYSAWQQRATAQSTPSEGQEMLSVR